MAIVDQSQVATTTLGIAQATSNFSTTSSTAVQVTGLSVTVTVPTGGRRIKITAYIRDLSNSSSSGYAILSIWDGAVGTGTLLNEGQILNATTPVTAIAVVNPSAGSKTYNIGLKIAVTGTGLIEAATTAPAIILVELV